MDVLLKREGYLITTSFRLYREEKLRVRRRGGRKRAIGAVDAMPDNAALKDLLGKKW